MPCYDSRTDDEHKRLRSLLEEGYGSSWNHHTLSPPPTYTSAISSGPPSPIRSNSTSVNVPQPKATAALIEAHKANAAMVPLLCSACRILTRMGYDFEENPALSQWWAAHQKEDAKKEKSE